MSKEQAEQAQLSAEQANDLAMLTAAAEEGEGNDFQETVTADPVDSLGNEVCGIVLAMVATLGPALPSLKRIYTPEVTKAAADSVARVCVKYGWLSDGLMGQWGEEIGAAVILVPLAVTTAQAVKGDIARLKAQAEESQVKAVENEAAPQIAEAEKASSPKMDKRKDPAFNFMAPAVSA